MHKARETLIQVESSEKIRRALRHNERSSNSAKFKIGDIVYFKRNGTVIGQEHKQVFIKYGGLYVRVHSCRVIHYDFQNNVRADASDNDENLGTDNMDASGSQKDQVDQNKSEQQSKEDRSSDNALSFSDSENETVDTIQSFIDSCPSNHLPENPSDKLQSELEKVQGSQKSKSVLLPKPNDAVSYSSGSRHLA